MKYFYCTHCEKIVTADEVKLEKEDNTFSVPFGDFYVTIGGSVDITECCPVCDCYIEEYDKEDSMIEFELFCQNREIDMDFYSIGDIYQDAGTKKAFNIYEELT